MSEHETRKFSTHRLEINMSYPFPTIVGLLSFFIFIASVALQNLPDYGMTLYLPIGWDGITMTEELAAAIRTMTTRASVLSILNSFYIVLLLIPLLIAFNFALSFGNGQIRTLVSYPIRREKLLLVKSGLVFILIATAVTLGGIIGLIFFYPFSIDVVLLGQLLIPLWATVFLITSSCTFIAVLSRSAPLTAVGGIGVWVGVFVMTPSQSIPSFLVYVLYPILAAINYILPDSPSPSPLSYLWTTSMNDVLYGCGVALVLGILLLYLSILVFRRLEV
jgi:hypothetical protein